MTDPRVIAAIQRDFIPYAHCGSPGLNNYRVLTASGKMLADHDRFPSEAMSAGLLEWSKLPEAERKPRVVTGLTKVNDYPKPPDPPKNGLILRSHVRGLQRDEDGDLTWTGQLAAGNGVYSLPAEPQLDHVWITQAEWKSMVPYNPSLGFTFEAPKRVAERIAMFHMLDKGLGCNNFVWEKASAKMTLKVVEVTDVRIKMDLSGKGLIGKDGNYPVRYQGIVEVDRKKGEISRFDVIALGRDGGDMRSDDEKIARSNFWYRIGPKCKVVMAIAFEKIAGDKPIDRVPPYAIMFDSAKTNNKPYFQPE
jgi:hypothetical protein